MKSTKRILATLLTLTLSFSLASPTMAAVDWQDIRITKQPPGLNAPLTISYGESFTLSVEVNVPEDIEVAYQWCRGASWEGIRIDGATEPELSFSPGDAHYPKENESYDYFCAITAYEKGGDASITKNSDYARVVMKPSTFWGKLYTVTISPFEYAFGGTASILALSWFTLIPLAPIVFLCLTVYYFGKNFIALF